MFGYPVDDSLAVIGIFLVVGLIVSVLKDYMPERDDDRSDPTSGLG